MINPHPSPYVPRGTAPPSSGPDPTLSAKHDGEAMQRAIERVQAHHENLRLPPEDFAERFGPRIINSATELTVQQIFAKLDVNVGARPDPLFSATLFWLGDIALSNRLLRMNIWIRIHSGVCELSLQTVW